MIFKLQCTISPFNFLATFSVCFFACRFSFHWASYLQWSMVAWQQLYFAATSYMIQTTWSRDTLMMNSFGLLSPYIWTSSTFSCLCWLFSELLIVEVLVLIGTYWLFSDGGLVVYENKFLSGNKSLWLPCCTCFLYWIITLLLRLLIHITVVD